MRRASKMLSLMAAVWAVSASASLQSHAPFPFSVTVNGVFLGMAQQMSNATSTESDVVGRSPSMAMARSGSASDPSALAAAPAPTDVTLVFPATATILQQLNAWTSQVKRGDMARARRKVTITEQRFDGTPPPQWMLVNAYPRSVVTSALTTGSGAVSTGTVTVVLSAESMTRR